MCSTMVSEYCACDEKQKQHLYLLHRVLLLSDTNTLAYGFYGDNDSFAFFVFIEFAHSGDGKCATIEEVLPKHTTLLLLSIE